MADLTMDRNLALEAVRVTEFAALAASRLMGRGDEKAADQAAKVAKTAFGLFGASKFGKFAREAAAQAQVAAKEQQQKISAPPSQNPSRTGSR